MARATLELLADSSQIRRATRDLNGVQRSGRGAERGTNLLAKAFVALAAAISVRQIVSLADAYTGLQNKLRIVTVDAENLLGVTEALNATAAESRQSIGGTVDLYAKLSRSTTDLGLSQKELIRLTSTITKSFSVAGATVAESDNAIRQLGQGLAAGALRGDEFNSVAEQAPGILRAVATETGLSVGALRAFAAEGKITTELLIRSLKNYAGTVDAEFAKTSVTIGQASTVSYNALTDLVGALDGATNASGTAAQAITSVGDGLDVLAVGVRSGAFNQVFSAAFGGIADDASATKNILVSEFGAAFGFMEEGSEGLGQFIGDAFYYIVPNIRAAIKIATVEITNFLNILGSYGAAVRDTLNPFDDVTAQQARNNFADFQDEVGKARLETLNAILLENNADKKSLDDAVVISNAKIEQYRKERKARIGALGGVVNSGGSTAENEGKTPIAKVSTDIEDGANRMSEALGTIDLEGFENRAAGAFAAVALGAQTGREAVASLATGIAQEAIGALIKMGIQSVTTSAVQAGAATAAQATVTAGAVASGATITAAMAPAAAATSIATAGAAPAAAAPIALSTIGIITAALIGGVAIAGARAQGGQVTGGSNYLVGERGPEVVSMGGTGKVTPFNQLMSQSRESGEGGVNDVIVNIINQGTSQSATSQTTRFSAEDSAFIVDVVVNDLDQRGQVHNTMTRTTTADNRT
jgi:tape measure domain-containing protein